MSTDAHEFCQLRMVMPNQISGIFFCKVVRNDVADRRGTTVFARNLLRTDAVLLLIDVALAL